MTLYEELNLNLKNLKSLYRFQGHQSFSFYKIEKFSDDYLSLFDSYIYFSKSFHHHLYYSEKKLIKLILDLIEPLQVDFSRKSLLSITNYHEILRIIEQSELKTVPISIELRFCGALLEEIKENAVSNAKKTSGFRCVEAVDLKKRGGGYGLCDEWLDLLNKMTILYAYHRVTKNELIAFFQIVRQNKIKSESKINPLFFLNNENQRNYQLSPHLSKPFMKYDIQNGLEEIVEKRLVLPNSKLEQNPQAEIRKIIESYTKSREETLTKLKLISSRKLELSK